MEKINEISLIKNEERVNSDLYTRYKKAFDQLLSLDDISDISNRELYIPDKEFDNELKSVVCDREDTISIVAGYAGIGKSTSLRNYFGFRNATPDLMGKYKDILIFPMVFNGYVEGIDKNENENCKSYVFNSVSDVISESLGRRITSTCSFLEKQFPLLKKRFVSETGQKEFFRYIEKTNPAILEYLPYEEMVNLDELVIWKRKLSLAYQYEKFLFETTRLKYYLSCRECGCKKIILILDDIEPLPYEQQFLLIMHYAKFFNCIKDRIALVDGKSFTANLLISMRPHTYQILKESRPFKSFFIKRIIYKKNMVNITTLLNRKIYYYSSDIPHNNEKTWNEACTIIRTLSTKFHSYYSEMIKDLSLWNTRDAVQIYKNVLLNRTWIQRNMERKAAFRISEDHYVFNNITVIRAIACGNAYVYRPSKDSIIPNILLNTKTKNYSLLILYIFLQFQPDKIRHYEYGTEAICFNELCGRLAKVFPEYTDIEEDTDFVIRYLFSCKVLRKSINDTEQVESLDKSDSLLGTSMLYLSPRGYQLWKMSSSDSVYMELCREDQYRNIDNTKDNSKSSFELLRDGKQISIFKDLFQMIDDLIKEEDKHVQYAETHNTLELYQYYFGETTVSKHFFLGICNSIDYSGCEDNKIAAQREGILSRLCQLTKRINSS